MWNGWGWEIPPVHLHQVSTSIIKCKTEPTTTRIKRLLEVLSSYSHNLYYTRAKDMILSHFLSRQKHDGSDPHEITPISLNMQNVLQSRYYNIGEKEQWKHLVHTKSQAKTSHIILPEVHGIDKGMDPNIRLEK